MRKLSLTDGKLSVEILPDCGGALSALRWTARDGRMVNLLRPASVQDITARNAGLLSCLPIGPIAHPQGPDAHQQPGLEEWTVQDASHVRATLTRRQEIGNGESPHSSYQLLQRLELGPQGLRLQLTVTNIGVQSMSAQIGFRLRPDWRGENILRLTPARGDTVGEPVAAYPLSQRDVHACLQHQGCEFRYEWPEERLALIFSPVRGVEHIGLDYWAGQREIWLTPLSHRPENGRDVANTCTLQKGDSLSTILLLSAAPLAA